MRITKIEGYELIVPTKPGQVKSPEYGKPGFDEIPMWIITMETELGGEGLGYRHL